MRSQKSKANDLFLLMLNLSQISLREKIIDIFLEAINEIWPNITPGFDPSYSESQNTYIEISTAGSNYGFIRIDNFNELKTEDQDLLHNACGMLAVLLKKNEHEILLADERRHLHTLVEKRTHHLNKEIQDRKQAEQKLLESEAKFRHLYETMTQGVVIQDADGRIIEANNAACAILGLSMDQMLGKTAYDPRWKMIREDGSPYDPTEVPSNIALRTGKASKSNHCGIYVPEKDEYRWIVIGSVPRFKDGETKPFVTTTVFTDITDLKNLESKLLQSQKLEAIGNLAGGIAHDFNNILSSIIGFTELSLDDVEKGTHIEDNLQEVYTAGKRAKNLVKQILAFARQSDEKRKPIQVDLIVKEVLQFIRSSIPTTIEIKQNIKSESLIIGNSTQIHQVIMNLCTNAAHAMEDLGGTLEVSLKDITVNKSTNWKQLDLKFGEYLEIKVADTGTGIQPENLKNVFLPYFTTKAPGEGTGMGLAMVHGIIESYGGKITVNSQLGKGTTFSIYLPITNKRKSLGEYVPEQLPTGSEHILFVDDEAPIAKMGGQILERLGYSVTTRTSSIEALELFRAKPNDFDLVVTDMTMPNMAGDKLAVELMKLRQDIPVILCTGYSKKITDQTAADIGIKAFTYKPIVKADLAKTVRKVLDEAKG